MSSPAPAFDRDRLLAWLADHGIAQHTVEHPAVFRVEEGLELKAAMPGAHTKNLFLKDKKGRVLLFVTLEDTEVDLRRLAERAGIGRPSFGKPDLLRELLGVEPGSVTPFALINDTGRRVRVALDRRMMEEEVLNFHPLVNDATTSIAPDDLLRFIRACGHEPMIVSLD